MKISMIRSFVVLGAGALSLGAGCATTKGPKAPPRSIVRSYTQGARASHANICWFETPAGPVVVDAPLSTSETKKLRKQIVQPYRIYVTSARPERFGGLQTLRDPDVPAFTTPAVATEIQDHGAARLAEAHRRSPDDVAERVQPPSPSIEERTHDIVGETEVELLPLGPAESESSLAVYLTRTGELITGDVVVSNTHADLTWGRSTLWQERLAELKQLEPKWICPGHGPMGGPELIDEMSAYLKFVHDAVAEKVKPGAPAKITPADKKAVRQKILARYPKLDRADLLDRSIPAEYTVQLAALAPEPAQAPAGALTPATPAAGAPAAATPTPAAASPAAASPAAEKKADKSANDELLGGSKKKKKK